MLTVAQVHLVRLLRPRVEAEVSLVGEVIRVEDELDERRFRDERLRLFDFPAEQSRFLSVGDVRPLVPVYDLEREEECYVGETNLSSRFNQSFCSFVFRFMSRA